MGGMYSTSHLDDGIFVVYRKHIASLSDEASRVFPVNHSMPSSNYNINHSEEVYMANILPSTSVIGSLLLDVPPRR